MKLGVKLLTVVLLWTLFNDYEAMLYYPCSNNVDCDPGECCAPSVTGGKDGVFDKCSKVPAVGERCSTPGSLIPEVCPCAQGATCVATGAQDKCYYLPG